MTMALSADLARLRVIPVVEIADRATAVPLARALIRAGLLAMEVTLRTPVALDAIRAVSAELPEFAVGAGTLLTSDDVAAATTAGARFLVSPGLTDALADAAVDTGLLFIPGAATASEVMRATVAGHRIVKFFPAEPSGGARTLAALIAPLRASGVRFMPTGGIRPENLGQYLVIPEVFAVGGTWIAPGELLAAGRFDEITDRASDALRLVSRSRHEGGS